MQKIKRIYGIFRDTWKKRQPRAAILLYHRVANLDSDPQQLAVTPLQFERQIRFLKEHYRIVSLQEMVQGLRNGSVPRGAIAITFDDGYADNLYYAKPILEKYGVPATVFVTTGMVGENHEFWWDALERIFLLNPAKQDNLEITAAGQTFFWSIKQPEDMVSIYHAMHPILKKTNHQEREAIMEQLLQWSGQERTGRASHRAITVTELKELADGDLIEIGAHCVNHCVLAMESEQTQKWELGESKRRLEEWLEKEVPTFSYPFGTESDFNAMTVKAAKECGFVCAVANIQGEVTKQSSMYEVPRRLVRNWDVNRLAAELNRFFLEDLVDVKQALERKMCGNAILRARLKQLEHQPSVLTQRSLTASPLRTVVQINTHDNVGGAAKVAFRLHSYYKEQGLNSRMLVGTAREEQEEIDVILQRQDWEQKWLLEKQEQQGWLDLFYLASLKLPDHLQIKAADVVHFHNLHGGYFSPYAVAEIAARKPVIWTLHDMQAITGHCAHSFNCDKWRTGCITCEHLDIYPALIKDSSHFLWQKKKSIYKSVKFCVVCPSQWLKDKVEKSILSQQTVRLIYNGIDTQLFQQTERSLARKKLGLPQQKKILLFSANGGAGNHWKGGAYIRQLFQQFGVRENEIMFLNLGQDGELCQQDNWRDVPYISDEKELALYYSAADIFVYPSLADNCPLVVLEAMSCGLPVVAFNTGGIPELVKHRQTGYIAGYEDFNDFQTGVCELLEKTKMRETMGRAAVERVREKFSIETMAQAYINLYQEMVTKV